MSTRPNSQQETPKKRCGAYIRYMSIERMRERLAAERAREALINAAMRSFAA